MDGHMQHHWLMPISCHFRDCKVLLVDSCKWCCSKCTDLYLYLYAIKTIISVTHVHIQCCVDDIHVGMKTAWWWTVIEIFPVIACSIVVHNTPILLANLAERLEARLSTCVGLVDNTWCACRVLLLAFAGDGKQHQLTLVVVILHTGRTTQSAAYVQCHCQ